MLIFSCLFTFEFQFFVYIFVNFSCLFSLELWISVGCLHFDCEFQLFVYILIVDFSCLFKFWLQIFSCLFTFQLWISAVCLHFSYDFQLFVYISNVNFSCLFILKLKFIFPYRTSSGRTGQVQIFAWTAYGSHCSTVQVPWSSNHLFVQYSALLWVPDPE